MKGNKHMASKRVGNELLGHIKGSLKFVMNSPVLARQDDERRQRGNSGHTHIDDIDGA